MDFKQIQELIKLINKSNIGEVTIEEKGFKITVKQKEEHVHQVFSAPSYPSAICTLVCSARRTRSCVGQPAREREIQTRGPGCR